MTKQANYKVSLLATTYRGTNVENLHYGWICVVNQDKKTTYIKGNVLNKVFLRSCAKPIQAIPLIENNIKTSPRELAIICASHNGSKTHLKVLNTLIKKFNLKLSDLKCGTHFPFDEDERKRLIKSNLSPNVLHNNCSGKHVGMLAVCKKNKWDLKNYLSLKHPLQKIILSKIKALSESKKIEIATDGCGVPTFSLPVINIAKMYSNLTSPKNKKYTKIISAMTKYPYFVGSKNQIDSEIMKVSKGKLIAKVGGEGIIIIAGSGNSLVIKVADGSPTIRSFIVMKLLMKLRWLKKSEIKNTILEKILTSKIKNHSGKVVGKIRAIL